MRIAGELSRFRADQWGIDSSAMNILVALEWPFLMPRVLWLIIHVRYPVLAGGCPCNCRVMDDHYFLWAGVLYVANHEAFACQTQHIGTRMDLQASPQISATHSMLLTNFGKSLITSTSLQI